MNLFYTKKAISPVIATALLLVVTVVAVVGFQNWYAGFESSIFTNTEQKSSSASGTINIEFISSDGIIYITNTGTENLSMSTIKIGDTDCLINQNLTPGVNNISISSCLGDDIISEVRIITDSGVIYEDIFTGEVVPLVIVLSSSLSCTTDLDGDGYIKFNCAVYPMINTTLEGYLDTNDNNATITADYTCAWNSNKSSCMSNYVVDGCGSGTVLDIGTGLCWQRNMSSYLDYDGTTLTWVQAKSYCNTTLDGLGGHNDWYLPSRQEFETIVDLSSSAPHIAGGNNKFQNVISNLYWTKTTYGPTTTSAFVVRLNDGNSNGNNPKFIPHYVACVRRD